MGAIIRGRDTDFLGRYHARCNAKRSWLDWHASQLPEFQIVLLIAATAALCGIAGSGEDSQSQKETRHMSAGSEGSYIPPALIFIFVCWILYVLVRRFGYKGDAYQFRMNGLKIFLAVVAVFAVLLFLFGKGGQGDRPPAIIFLLALCYLGYLFISNSRKE
jgi:hypothetical protein